MLFEVKLYLPCLIYIALVSSTVAAQSTKDTIFLDEDWSVCEKPVAEYYRVASLQISQVISYVGNVTDYYIDGNIEMKGTYDGNGMKNGHFAFFEKNGKKRKEGNFTQDEMTGVWNYYNENEDIVLKLDCKSAVEFTPLLLVASSGDTLLKGGNGHFVFNTQADLPKVFPVAVNYTVEGQVIDGKKEGEYKYWINAKEGKQQPFCTNVFKNGIFKRTRNDNGYSSTDKPCNPLNLLAESNLLKTDNFFHTNLVFGSGEAGDKKLIDFLIKGKPPEIKSEASSYSQNIKEIYDILGTVLRPALLTIPHSSVSYSYPPPVAPQYDLLNYKVPASSSVPPRMINCLITLTIDTAGYVVNSVFKGNLKRAEIEKINYYLLRLSNLAPFTENGTQRNNDLKIRLVTLLNTSKDITSNNVTNCIYLALQDNSSTVNDEEREASFVGGTNVWAKYLQMNLDATAPEKDNAPDGVYSVKIQFIVDEEGNIGEVHALEAPAKCPRCTAEAERIIRECPNWEPAVHNGKKVKFKVSQTVTFTK